MVFERDAYVIVTASPALTSYFFVWLCWRHQILCCERVRDSQSPRSSVSMLTRVVSSRALGVAISLVELSCCFCDSASSIGFEFGVVEVGARSLALGVSFG